MARQGMLLIISGPSGVGKTTSARDVEKRMGARFRYSMTTRPRAEKDVEGVDYYFVDRAAFEGAIERDELLEWAQVFENYYGTPRRPVEAALAAGELIILEIDVQGARQVKQRMPDAYAMFIKPPSEAELLRRLRARAREDEAVIQKRFANAKREIALAESSDVYDLFIVNEQLDRAIDEAVTKVNEERARRCGSRLSK